VKIVTDSTAYLPEELVASYRDILRVVPLTVIFPDESLVDGLAILDCFLAKLKEFPAPPTTSQPTPQAFAAAFEELLCDEEDEIIALTISSQLSGTMTSAKTAAKMVGEERISIIDSQSTSAGLALPVLSALEQARAGLPRAEIVRYLEDEVERSRLLFIPDTLEYLKKGGRIGGASALVGSLLQIKPVLQVKGQVDVFDRVRTRKKAMQLLLNQVPEAFDGTVAVLHVACPERALELQGLIAQKAPQARLPVFEVGPVIATHSGPGAFGIAYLENREQQF